MTLVWISALGYRLWHLIGLIVTCLWFDSVMFVDSVMFEI